MDTTADLREWRDTSVAQWTDSRIVPAAWIEEHLWFFMHSYADWAQIGATVRGFTFREKQRDWLLVIKLLVGDTPRVVFVGSSTPTRCMAKLHRQLLEGEVRMREDKYG